ncbi:protein FAM57A isoform A [Alligator mississippiensis]|uniref:Protein FAM57A isoform A n=1 Tax=Alligator mississippiensis TaxID=8496 RepID=A0A151NAF6_ALLMI|nr:protein FAM57A isoform A [Alligator mississippiensis]
MWQTLPVASVLFPGLFALCIRSLGWAAPAWSLKDRILLSGRLVSSVQAVMAAASGIIVVLNCKDVIHDRHWLAVEYVWVIVPYMTYDIYVMYLCHWHRSKDMGTTEKKNSLASVRSFLKKERLMVTHHLFILIVLTPITQHFRGELGDFFVGCIFLAELSTPFVSLGKTLMQLNMQDTRLHKVNGVLILVTFLLCRILLFPFMYGAYARQLYWFVLICRKALRLYSCSSSDKSR